MRQRVSTRVARSLRRQLGSTRRCLATAVTVAVLALAAVALFVPRPTSKAQPILLGRGRAGVLGKDAGAANRSKPDPTGNRHRSGSPQPSAAAGRGAGSGPASYYGDELRGRRTASGEAFNPEGLTAAHRSLPLGSRVRVTNLTNGRSVVVRVNDRGPYAGDRVIDVSKRAARALGMLGRGTARVRLELLPS